MPPAATDHRREGKLRRQGLRLARQLQEPLRCSRTAGPHLLQASGACARDGGHPGVRLARVHPPGLGLQGPLLLPLEGRLRAHRALIQRQPGAENGTGGGSFRQKVCPAPFLTETTWATSGQIVQRVPARARRRSCAHTNPGTGPAQRGGRPGVGTIPRLPCE